jgi:CelD/BcsL family acetyltransferase involved in cellulose biosynthesis
MGANSTNDVVFLLEELPPLTLLESEWRKLEKLYSASFFTSWSWIGNWLTTLPSRLELKLVRVQRDEVTIALAIAGFRQARRFRLFQIRQLFVNATGDSNCDCITIEHNDFVGERGLIPKFAEWFSATDCADELVIQGSAPHNVPALPNLVRWVRESPAYAHDLSPKSEPRQALSRNTRQQISRNFRALGRFGMLNVDEAKTPEIALAYFAALKAFHVRSWDRRGRRNAFSSPYFEIFHRALISAGAGQLLRARAGESVLGYLYNFRHAGTVYAYQSGFADEFERDRPGYVCHALAMAESAVHGVTRYDFLAGDNRLKRSMATAQYTLAWCIYGRATPLLRLHAAVGRVLNGYRNKL